MTMLPLPADGGAAAGALPRLTSGQARPLVVRGPLHRAVMILGDVLGAVVLALCVPFAILAVGAPIALLLRLLLWMVGMA